MSDIKQFTQAILQDKQNDLQKQFQDKQQAVLAHYDTLKQAIDERVSKKREQMLQDVTLQQNIAKQQLDNQKRNAVLQQRQVNIDALFDKAVLKMASLPQDQVAQFVNKALSQLDSTKSYVITFGEQTVYDKPLPSHVHVNADKLPNQSGFVIDSDGVRLNYLFEQLVAQVKRDYVATVNQALQ